MNHKCFYALPIALGYSELFEHKAARLSDQTSFEDQQCGILTSVDSDTPLQPSVKLRNSKCWSASSLTDLENSCD